MRSLSLVTLAFAACGAGDSRAPAVTAAGVSAASVPGAVSQDTTKKPAAATAPTDSARGRRIKTLGDSTPVRGLYLNRFAAQSTKRMRELIAIADSTEINAFVIDVKDEFGLNFKTVDPLFVKNSGGMGHGVMTDVRALLDSLHAHKIITIARIVTFKDPVAAAANPQHTIRKTDGTPWKDKKNTTWVNPYDRDIWEYNIRVAETMLRAGFDEIQFDYIRFPEPYKSLPTQVFPGEKGPKSQVLADFLTAACDRIHKFGARCTADVFGLVTTVNGALEIGQDWSKLAPIVDAMLPMVYPSHYPHGAFGLERPNAEPYKVIVAAITKAHQRNDKLGVKTPEQVRPWLQAFTLGKPAYGPDQIKEQKRAVYDAGYDGWVMWHPGSKYEPFVPALERTLLSHKKKL